MLSFGLFPMVKVLVSILVVVLLSLIAEHAGPRVAGVVSGYPLGAAISLLFIGIEISPAFAARSAVFTAAGLTGTVAFVGGYLLGLKAAEGRRRLPALGIALIPALAAYGLTAWGVSLVSINRGTALVIAMASMILADRVFRTIPDTAIHTRIQLGFGVTLLRAVFAALVILAITTAARAVGPEWAGLFSAFPITMLPLLVIIQFTYEPAHVRTIIKDFNQNGFDALVPKYGGGRPKKFHEEQRSLIVETALCPPDLLGQPFTRWSLPKLRDFVIEEKIVDSISV